MIHRKERGSDMVVIFLISHSKKITDGLKEMIEEMTGTLDDIKIISAGGTEDGRLGTNPVFIYEQIQEYQQADQFYLFADIGSAVMSVDTVLDMLDDELKDKCVYLDAPLVEGAFVGSVQCMVDPSKEAVVREVSKLYRETEN